MQMIEKHYGLMFHSAWVVSYLYEKINKFPQFWGHVFGGWKQD